MTFEEYKQRVMATRWKNSEWREGQAYFNVLWEVRPDLAKLVQGSGSDPFYQDRVIPWFLHWVKTNWDSQQ